MQNQTNIKYLLIGNTDTAKVITDFTVNTNKQTQAEAKQIFEKMSKAEIKFEERNKILRGQEYYYFATLAPNIFYLALADPNYPERKVFEMFDTINKDHIPLMVNDKGELNPSGKQMLKKIVDDFQNAKDKINDIHADVREIQIDMKNNIKNIVANVDDAKKLQQTSDNIRVGADTYKKNAGELKRVTWWQNCKLTIIIISVVVVIALVIIIPLVVKS